jgi:ferric-dicitrate binding protein FerR (iron transport regulator)
MDLNRFKECAAAYGAERRRWPAREHARYDRFAGTPEGAAILAEAERTDRFLDRFEVAAPDAALAAAIADARARGRRGQWWQASAFAASALLGFVLGFTHVPDDAGGDLVSQLLLGPTSVREIGP